MNKRWIVWFLLGLGGGLQIISSLSFTELFVFAAAPVLFFKEQEYMKRNGIMPFFWLSMAVFVGCIIAIIANHTPFRYALRGLAVTSLLPCSVVVGHWMLRRDMAGFKWSLVGGAISGVVSTFVFQKAADVTMLADGETGSAAVEAIMGGALYWKSRVGSFLMMFPKGWYLNFPIFLSAAAPLFMVVFSMLITVSGRGTAVTSAGTAVLVLLGGKKPSSIRRGVSNRFWLLVAMGMVGVFVLKFAYQTSAEKGWLGEASRKKYEDQTKGDKSLKALLLGGRMESFCGLIACMDKPIVGFGPWARDEYGYIDEFLSRYANIEDYQHYLSRRLQIYSMGLTDEGLIPCHAYITEFWLWYGIFGLLFWLYVIFVLLRYIKQDCWAVPQWYMWLAASLPGYFWGIFFSPWSSRVGGVMFVVACLMARAVRQGRCQLPIEMVREIEKVEGRC